MKKPPAPPAAAPALNPAASEALFAAALTSGLTVRESARVAGLSERTAYRRLSETGIRRELALRRSEVCEEAASRLRVGAIKAARTVEELLEHKDAKVRLAAAKTAVALSRELSDEAARLATYAANLGRGAPAIDVDALEVTLAEGEELTAALERQRLTLDDLRAASMSQAEVMAALEEGRVTPDDLGGAE